jgi:hypothetical protein
MLALSVSQTVIDNAAAETFFATLKKAARRLG